MYIACAHVGTYVECTEFVVNSRARLSTRREAQHCVTWDVNTGVHFVAHKDEIRNDLRLLNLSLLRLFYIFFEGPRDIITKSIIFCIRLYVKHIYIFLDRNFRDLRYKKTCAAL